ncbi:MAG: hypothetical protein FWD44_03675 [Oscillospiraceae bacterium]|nr:hypothetical protein [Oscillospiraceae bacterium]
MKSSGIGVGSISIVLVFTVLSLTVFSLIMLYVSGNDKALVDAKAEAVKNYYSADAEAEAILAEIMSSENLPESINGSAIYSEFDSINMTEKISFVAPISETTALYVNIVRKDDNFDILSWKMVMIDTPGYDGSLNLWPGTSN